MYSVKLNERLAMSTLGLYKHRCFNSLLEGYDPKQIKPL